MAPSGIEKTTISLIGCSTSIRLTKYHFHQNLLKLKRRQQRIAKELMYASWQVYNQITMTVKKVIQICKPEHKLFKT